MSKSPDAFRTISEVAEWLETPAHVLRFWESKFAQVKPVKRAGGRRYYRPADMALLGGIKKLLHDDGMTIKGAQKVLREQGVRYVSSLCARPLDGELPEPVPDGDTDTDAEAPFAHVGESTGNSLVAFPGAEVPDKARPDLPPEATTAAEAGAPEPGTEATAPTDPAPESADSAARWSEDAAEDAAPDGPGADADPQDADQPDPVVAPPEDPPTATDAPAPIDAADADSPSADPPHDDAQDAPLPLFTRRFSEPVADEPVAEDTAPDHPVARDTPDDAAPLLPEQPAPEPEPDQPEGPPARSTGDIAPVTADPAADSAEERDAVTAPPPDAPAGDAGALSPADGQTGPDEVTQEPAAADPAPAPEPAQTDPTATTPAQASPPVDNAPIPKPEPASPAPLVADMPTEPDDPPPPGLLAALSACDHLSPDAARRVAETLPRLEALAERLARPHAP